MEPLVKRIPLRSLSVCQPRRPIGSPCLCWHEYDLDRANSQYDWWDKCKSSCKGLKDWCFPHVCTRYHDIKSGDDRSSIQKSLASPSCSFRIDTILLDRTMTNATSFNKISMGHLEKIVHVDYGTRN
jgi:hypothetical protein